MMAFINGKDKSYRKDASLMIGSYALVAADGLGRFFIYNLYWDEVGALVKWSTPSLSIYMKISVRADSGIIKNKPTTTTKIAHLDFLDK